MNPRALPAMRTVRGPGGRRFVDFRSAPWRSLPCRRPSASRTACGALGRVWQELRVVSRRGSEPRRPADPSGAAVAQQGGAVATTTRRRSLPELAGPECCPAGLTEPLDRPTAESLATLLKAVADPARLQLLALLRAAEAGE